MTPEQIKQIELLIANSYCRVGGNHYCPNCDNAIGIPAEALRAALAEITRLREERANPTCTRVCQVPCCGQTIIDRTPSGQIPCGDY
jgi:hypothetical protein